MTNWTPGQGDVAVISWQSKSGRHGGTQLALRCSDDYAESHWQSQAFGIIADDTVTNVRPLVVIDPENREQVERLVREFSGQPSGAFLSDIADTMQAALRSLVTPPRPAEPTGLGAVIEDADGNRWVRTAANEWISWDIRTEYRRIDVVRVLSEGVTP